MKKEKFGVGRFPWLASIPKDILVSKPSNGDSTAIKLWIGRCVYYGVIGLHVWYTEDTQGDHY